MATGAPGYFDPRARLRDELTDTVLRVLPSGAGYPAGVEVLGRLQHTPIPRKLKSCGAKT